MKQSAPLSQSQYGIYVECTNHQGEVYYNLPFLFALDPSLDGERLRQAVETTVRNHPTLFTRIEVDAEGEPCKRLTSTRRNGLCNWRKSTVSMR